MAQAKGGAIDGYKALKEMEDYEQSSGSYMGE